MLRQRVRHEIYVDLQIDVDWSELRDICDSYIYHRPELECCIRLRGSDGRCGKKRKI
jgi:hypothetical protein